MLRLARALPASVLLLATTVLAADAHKSAGKAPAAINVTGTWSANFSGGMDLLLQQDGNSVQGKDNLGFLLRGDWRDGRLTLFYRLDFKGDPAGSCSAPVVAVLTSPGTATRLDGVEFLAEGTTAGRTLTRSSPAAGPDFAYPFGAELKVCGSLPAHDLVFASGGDALQGTDWPLLAAVAGLLKTEAGLKIQVSGHTDSTGDAQKNKELSQRRAESVKKVLVGKYGADAARIATRGFGAEQPVASNDTEEGRSVNRRVEILIVR